MGLSSVMVFLFHKLEHYHVEFITVFPWIQCYFELVNTHLENNIGRHIFGPEAIFGWDLAVIRRIFLEKCSVHYIYNTMGVLVIDYSCDIWLYPTIHGYSCDIWLYFRGVCISDLIPFYLGKLFRQSRVSDDVLTKVSPSPTFLLMGSFYHFVILTICTSSVLIIGPQNMNGVGSINFF